MIVLSGGSQARWRWQAIAGALLACLVSAERGRADQLLRISAEEPAERPGTDPDAVAASPLAPPRLAQLGPATSSLPGAGSATGRRGVSGVPGAQGLPGAGPGPAARGGTRSATTPVARNRGGGGASSLLGIGQVASNPHVIGDFFDGGARVVNLTIVESTSFFAPGTRLGTSNQGAPIYAFERDGSGFPDDVFTDGNPGQDLSPGRDGFADTFAIAEPLPPNEVPTSPGGDFAFDGGTATYTNSTTSTTPADGDPLDGQSWFIEYAFSRTQQINVPAGGGGVAVRRFKIAENNSPIPADRYFFLYNFFNDVTAGLGDVNRVALGLEKTYARGLVSFELRVPFAGTLDHDQVVDQPGARNSEFGNLMFAFKELLLYGRDWAWSAGIGVTLPTASSTRLQYADGRTLLLIPNQAVHFLPFTAATWNPDPMSFMQLFLQFDLDPYGNEVLADARGSLRPAELPSIGKLNDAPLLFVDYTMGRWLFRDRSSGVIRGLAPVVEFHYATTMRDTDMVSGNGVQVGDVSRRIDVLNLTLGTHLLLGRNLRVATAASLPLRHGQDRPFSAEGILQANWFF